MHNNKNVNGGKQTKHKLFSSVVQRKFMDNNENFSGGKQTKHKLFYRSGSQTMNG